ncbi:Sjogren's syndrome/scleroderma autoantigen 1 family protein [Halococcoides cellulosivorans]|uniref:Sjogrens syndrome scleroderma autoantigen 1 n=1 Tax=Halococcoides cellulosivorans TaxID=1679096 RepID=A0A2R4X325_9EURY|nr:Sjogren's syndrome/scleroderma autoantigen 1 family protein [Halococcoides cellulosivorans]AWB28198.1 hypothetical protein HARCEL1_11025 [Halococcoides cellulosivorans]
MSEFDEEAERERLREQYEQDQADRESTQRMSDLLLKGATMTNAHCGTCGDPIFRQNDEEFCPTCQEAVAVEESDAEADDVDHLIPQREADADGAADAQSADPSQSDRSPSDASAAAAEPSTGDRAAADQSAADRSPTVDRSGEAGRDPLVPEQGADRSTAQNAQTTVADRSGDAIVDSRAAVETTLERFATAAAETSDPRRAQDHLAAAREAAETLAALDRL